MDKTSIYDINILRDELILLDLKEIINILKERGYNPFNQLVGYLTTHDELYITSYKNARKMIKKYEINEIINVLLKSTLGE